MKQVAILMDYLGYPLRFKTLRDTGIEVHSTKEKTFEPPDNWLPENNVPKRTKHWFKCDSLAFSFIQRYGIKADFYWIIEYDVAASVERWKALFSDPVKEGVDGLFICPRTQKQAPAYPYWSDPGTDERATHFHLQALYGLSARAVAWCIEDAESKRNTFCELCTASSIVARGGKIETLNRNTTHCNSQTMRADPTRVLFDRKLINHPIKQDTYGVDTIKQP